MFGFTTPSPATATPRPYPGFALALLGWTVMLIAGCESGPDQAAKIQPNDFLAAEVVNWPTPPRPDPDAARVTDPVSDPGVASARPTNTNAFASDDMPQAVSGMIGQVNGNPIYAEDVLGPLEARLQARARELTPTAWKREATQAILQSLDRIIIQALILGAAERDLSAEEQAALPQLMQNKRAELMRLHGLGSAAVANAVLLDQTGLDLEGHLKRFREQVIVGRYTSKIVGPKINVTRRDMERFFTDHADEFNRPASRTVRLIMVTDEDARDRVQRELEQGVAFETVASDRANRIKADQGGLWGEVNEPAFQSEEVNTAIVELRQGQWRGPIAAGARWWWVFVEEYFPAVNISFDEAQSQIMSQLLKQQEYEETLRHRMSLLETGSYTGKAEMAQTLMSIAIDRFLEP